MIEAREKQGLTQRDLAKISGVKQPAIARIESLRSTPQLDTLLKVLIPLGYSLEIIPFQPLMHICQGFIAYSRIAIFVKIILNIVHHNILSKI